VIAPPKPDFAVRATRIAPGVPVKVIPEK